MRKCTYCRHKLKDKWDYCPHCGTQVNKQISMFGLLKKQMDIMRNLMLNDNFYDQRNERPRTGLTIRIDSRRVNQPRMQVFARPVPAREKEPYQGRVQNQRTLPANIIEPKVHVKRLAKEMIITIPIPGVKSGKDVELNRFTNSLEVRAFAKDKGYFKILNIPKSHKLVEKTLSDESLSLKFAI